MKAAGLLSAALITVTACTTTERSTGRHGSARSATEVTLPGSAPAVSHVPSPASPPSPPPLPVEQSMKATPSCPQVLLAARKGGAAADRYVRPNPAQQSAMTRLFERLFSEGPSAARADATPLGFVLSPLPDNQAVWSLVEQHSRMRGGGAYLIRPLAESHLIVQAPHTFYDEGTLPLACELFQRAGARALFIETAHRYKAAEAEQDGAFPADLAHAEDSLFQAATAGALAATASTTIVQLHGFAARDSRYAVVLSSGARRGSAQVDRVQQALSPLLEGVARFPQEASELGATTNVQGKLARRSSHELVHIELSAPLRTRLLDDPVFREAFLEAVVKGLTPH
jgi:hypothetical protein